MGKAGRIACIFTPMALTVASLVFMILVEVGGWNAGSSSVYSAYTLQVDFRYLTVGNAPSGSIGYELAQAKGSGLLGELYQLHLWNYCSSNLSSGAIDYCSDRQSEFSFDPVSVWHLNATGSTAARSVLPRADAVSSTVDSAASSAKSLETQFLGDAGATALDAYRNASKWMFISFAVAFWTTVATILVGLLAICSRWGSFFTWIFAVASAVFSFAASLTATILFSTLAGALKAVLDNYNVDVSVGTRFLALTWIATACSVGATLFWLFSVCCCPGSSNPHHRSNKGGLWNGQSDKPGAGGYGDYNRGRGGLRVEKTGGGYQRVASPYMGAPDHHGDRVPLHDYPQPHGYNHMRPGDAYEPFRRQDA